MNLNNGNHNPGVVPGYYDPRRQAKTELNDYAQYLDLIPGYVDPTQIPMIPGDTQVPLQPPVARQREEVKPSEVEEEQYRRFNQSIGAKQAPQPISPPIEYVVSPQQNSVAPIRVPIIIEVTINLNIKHE